MNGRGVRACCSRRGARVARCRVVPGSSQAPSLGGSGCWWQPPPHPPRAAPARDGLTRSGLSLLPWKSGSPQLAKARETAQANRWKIGSGNMRVWGWKCKRSQPACRLLVLPAAPRGLRSWNGLHGVVKAPRRVPGASASHRTPEECP